MSEHPRGRLGRKLSILGVAFVLGLGAAELWLRTLSPVQLGFGYSGGRFHRPAEFRLHININRLGFHDAPPEAVTPGRSRVLLLGDSYVEAASVSIDQTVGRRLAQHLGASVVALGRSTWGQAEELAALEAHGPELGPDLVVTLFLPFNDVRNNHPPLQRVAEAQLAELARFRPGWSSFAREDARLFVCEWSVLNRLVSHRLTRAAAGEQEELPIDYRVYATELDPTWSEAWRRTEELLLKTRLRSEELGARYAIVSASTPHGVLGPEAGLAQLEDAYPALARGEYDLRLPAMRLAAFCAREKIPFLDLEPLLARIVARDDAVLHWPFDGHWNVEGNAAAAREMAAFLGALLGS